MAISVNADINFPRGAFSRVFNEVQICEDTLTIRLVLSGTTPVGKQIIYDHRSRFFQVMEELQRQCGTPEWLEIAGQIGSEEMKLFNSPAKVVIMNQFGRVNIHLYEPDDETTAYLSTPLYLDGQVAARHVYHLTFENSLYGWLSGEWPIHYRSGDFVYLTLTDRDHKVAIEAIEEGLTVYPDKITTTTHVVGYTDELSYKYSAKR